MDEGFKVNNTQNELVSDSRTKWITEVALTWIYGF